MNMKDLMIDIHQTNVEKGFWENKADRNVGEVLMLCVSELAEALEAHRKNKKADIAAYKKEVAALPTEEKNNISAINQVFKTHIKDSFEDEIADTVIRLFDMSEAFGIDLEWHVKQKLAYNKSREHKHGKAY